MDRKQIQMAEIPYALQNLVLEAALSIAFLPRLVLQSRSGPYNVTAGFFQRPYRHPRTRTTK
jgi:hypothetical protein